MVFSQFTTYFLVAVLIQTILFVIIKREGIGARYLYLLAISHIGLEQV